MSGKSSTTVGVIGLGKVGSTIASLLLEGNFETVGYDINEDPVESLVERGAKSAATPAETMSVSDVVILSLPSPAAVEEVTLGENGIIEETEPGKVLVDTSTSLPSLTANLATAVAAEGGETLGAPLSGGGDDSARYTAMVGGDPAVYEACKSIFEVFTSTVILVGPDPAQGHAAKLLNQYLSFSAWILTSEAIALGEDVGLEMRSLLDIINASSGRNSKTESSFPSYVESGKYDLGAPIRIMEKDVHLLLHFAYSEGVMLSFGPQMYQVVGYANAELGGEADLSRIYEFVKGHLRPSADFV